jgi:hypothetical protein
MYLILSCSREALGRFAAPNFGSRVSFVFTTPWIRFYWPLISSVFSLKPVSVAALFLSFKFRFSFLLAWFFTTASHPFLLFHSTPVWDAQVFWSQPGRPLLELRVWSSFGSPARWALFFPLQARACSRVRQTCRSQLGRLCIAKEFFCHVLVAVQTIFSAHHFSSLARLSFQSRHAFSCAARSHSGLDQLPFF